MIAQNVNDNLLRDLKSIGVRSGKPLYVRAALTSIGKVEGGLKAVLLPTLMQAIGEEGTLVAPHFSSARPVWVDTSSSKQSITSGALSKLILKDPQAVISGHNTHSFVAIGPMSKSIVDNHSNKGACFEPIRAIQDNDGDMLLIGCVGTSPGFSTVHLAQHDLGILKKHYYRYLLRGMSSDAAISRSEKVFESPGCSSGFGKFYSEYMQRGLLSCGYIGNAYAILINAKKAYELEYELLTKNRKFYLCSDPSCVSCRLLNGNNIYDMPACLLANFAKVIKKRP